MGISQLHSPRSAPSRTPLDEQARGPSPMQLRSSLCLRKSHQGSVGLLVYFMGHNDLVQNLPVICPLFQTWKLATL